MKVIFEASFVRDLKKSRNKRIFKKVQQLISDVKLAQSQNDLVDIKKIQGYESYYRLRLGDYRIGVEIDGDQVIFVRFLHRKDIYRYFP